MKNKKLFSVVMAFMLAITIFSIKYDKEFILEVNGEEASLYREKRLAKYWNSNENHYEWIGMFTLNGRPAYCIEPFVSVLIDGQGNGPTYNSQQWRNLSEYEMKKLGRVMWFGHGHPQSGTGDNWYLATLLLIWQIVAPQEYALITQDLKLCTPADTVCSVVGGNVDVSYEMGVINNLIDNYDTVPSFGDEWHGTPKYNLDWDETLVLEDNNNVLDWFNDYSQEEHKGINIKRDNNKLLVDIDDIYYDGYDTVDGKTLTFKRNEKEWTNYMQSITLYTSGNNQKLSGMQSKDPSEKYKLSFKLNTANLELRKQDEYYNENNFTSGTEYVIGWYQDLEI